MSMASDLLPSVSSPIPLPAPFTSTVPPPTLVTQGAEALVYRTTFLLSSWPCALKYRPPKPYRHPVLDARLTRHRILSEARVLVKCRREGVAVPGVLAVEWEAAGGGGWMLMEWIEGRTVKEVLLERKGRMDEEEGAKFIRELMGKIGRVVGRLHEVGVVHGDLTTSNLMLRSDGKKAMEDEAANSAADDGDAEIVLIDFGLAAQSLQEEDKGVDLYVLERAFGSTHPEAEVDFKEVLKAYGESYKGGKSVLKRLEEVRMRGRKRSMLG
ncbi:serine/threonine-protein kinase bud32 [Pseudocyphellaria aurata]|nr:serine/threonine-protein kinase bud32 [Pseudocyphellaria aurata]